MEIISNMFVSLVLLFGVHCVADFPLQNEFIEKYKGTSDYILLCHCAIYTLTVIIGLYFTSLFSQVDVSNWCTIVAIIFFSHVIIDKWKCSHVQDPEDRDDDDHHLFFIDQLLHVMILYAIYGWMILK